MNYRAEQNTANAVGEHNNTSQAPYGTAKISPTQAESLQKLRRDTRDALRKRGPFGTYNFVL